MEQERFSFDSPTHAGSRLGAAPVHLVWSFDASSGLDKPFHGLISRFGDEIIMDLDQIVLDSPVRAAMRATKVYQQYSAQMHEVDHEQAKEQVREVMVHMASVLKPKENVMDEDPLLPPEAVFEGFARPRG